jgi:hypothetical protein
VALGAVEGAAVAGAEAALGVALAASGTTAALSEIIGVDRSVRAPNSIRSPITISIASARPTTAPTTNSAVRLRRRLSRGADALDVFGAAAITCMSGAAVDVEGSAENCGGAVTFGVPGTGSTPAVSDCARRFFEKSAGIRVVPCRVTFDAGAATDAVGSVSHDAVGSSFAVVRPTEGSLGGAPNVTTG